MANKGIRDFKGVDARFTDLCRKAGTPATHRQYRKYLQGRGKAFQASGQKVLLKFGGHELRV